MGIDLIDSERWESGLRKDKPNVVYILRLCNDDLYIGSTTNFHHRMKDHLARLDQGARMTRKNPAIQLMRVECFGTYNEARRREMQIKGWTRAKKEALIEERTMDLYLLSHGKEPL